ncbi:MAG: outer membrane beta-barrel protein, partial [Candidatus Brocadiales bacterium]
EIGEFRAMMEEKKLAGEPEAGPLTDSEATALRGFLDQFQDITFGGFVDNYYQWESIDPNAGDNNAINPKVFDKQVHSFTVRNIEMWLYKEAADIGDVGFKITLNWGDTARRITFVGPVADDASTITGGRQTTFSEGYVTWKAPIGKGLDIKFGKFATWVGYEVWESIWNPNSSRSYIYGWGIPFTNQGVGFSYPILDNLTGDFYFTQSSDTFVNNNRAFTYGTQWDYNPADISIFKGINVHLDTLWGQENASNDEQWIQRYDVTVSFSPLEKWSFANNFNYGHAAADGAGANRVLKTTQLWGNATYIIYQHNDWLGGAVRGEYFWDQDNMAQIIGGTNTLGGSLFEITGTMNILLRDHLWIRPEIRYDEIVHVPGGDDSPGLNPEDAWDNNGTHDANLTFSISSAYEW